jgi:hypothetical protein
VGAKATREEDEAFLELQKYADYQNMLSRKVSALIAHEEKPSTPISEEVDPQLSLDSFNEIYKVYQSNMIKGKLPNSNTVLITALELVS